MNKYSFICSDLCCFSSCFSVVSVIILWLLKYLIMHLLSTTILVTEKLILKMSNLEMDCYSQNGRSLEEYVEEFLEHYHDACWDNETLKQLFWNRMDGIIWQKLLLKEDHLSFHRVHRLCLVGCRSSLTLGVIEEDTTINSNFLGLSRQRPCSHRTRAQACVRCIPHLITTLCVT